MNTDYMQVDSPKVGAECAADGQTATAVLQERLLALVRGLDTLGTTDALRRAEILVQLGHTQLELEQKEEAWDSGKEAFRIYVRHEDWEGAVTACDVMFFADRPDSLAALGHGLWLAVTYPVNPELSVAMLQHLVEETPADADGAAVAAATAHFIADVRAQGPQRDSLLFFTNQLLGQVARRHGQVESQAQFEAWFARLELDNPDLFIPRLGLVIDVLVRDNWWIDRDALRERLPE